MKRIYQYLMLAVISGSMLLTVPANAQRGGGHSGGGGGGGRSGGGGGGGFSRGGGGGFSGGSRPSGGFSGGSRPSGGSFSSPRQSYSGGSFSRGRTNSAFSSPGGNAYRGGAHQSSPSFSRPGVGNRYSYRGGATNGYRPSIRGGYSRGGRYYPGGYGYNRYSYGYRYSPWYNHGGYYYNRGFYGSLYGPRLGFGIGVLPYGYYPFYWGDAQFYYSGGYFYQYNNDQYTVVEPPIGAAINSLPGNAQAININGQQYYEANGVYYTPITKDDGSVVYQVAGKDGQLDTGNGQDDSYAPSQGGYAAPSTGGAVEKTDDMPTVGDMFFSLPADSRKVKIAGQSYWVSPDDFYYQETRDQQGNKAYKVIGTPDDNPGN